MTARYLAAAALACSALASAAGAQTIAITGGKVYPVSGPPIENGTVLIRDGRIAAVGTNVSIPADAQRIDATGKVVTPGLVNPSTELGLVAVGFGGDANESNARTDSGLAPSFKSWDGLDPRSVYIAATREDGITSNVTVPVGGLIAGQAAFIDLVNGTREDMLLKAPAAMVGQINDNQSAHAGARGQLLGTLRSLLDDAKYYASHRAEFDRAQSRRLSVSRADLEAMVPVVQGRVPLLLEAEKASDIGAALDLAKQYGIKLIIAGGAEAWMVADRIAAAKVPVLVGAMNNIPYSFTMLGARQDNAALLRRAGVQVALIGNAGGGDEEMFNARNIRYEAGNAVGYGMSWDDALRAVTLAPAEMFGVADRVGSLQAGREANVVVWSGDPFEFATRPTQVFVRGVLQHDVSRQDLLTQRYKTLPPSYGKKE
ncbi:MAG TPA: amidohydrolase family protein [Gemmatimonadaceae bacterium]|nr:amidohydrolase family protein [Gemmatimonadaceae bacterium]